MSGRVVWPSGNAVMDENSSILRGTLFASGQAKPCIVRMTSSSEACIATYFPERLPDSFRLYLVSSGLEVDCVVAWRGPKELGVRLMGTYGDNETVCSIAQTTSIAGKRRA